MGSLMMLRISGSSSMVTTLGKSVSLVTLRSIIRIGSTVQFSQCKKRRLQHHHHQSRVLVCRVVATATAAAQGEGTFTVKQKGTTVQGLPPAPSEASLTTVMPYLWSLASSDTTLRWRLAAALVLLVVSKAAGLAGPVLLKQAMDDLAQPPTLNATPALVALILAALSKAVSAGLNEVRYIIFAPLGQATARRVGVQLLDHILRLDLAFHLE
ncbi:unnamed protein product [Sphagnum troendelagicum]|uniref:ABC transmembrane type-1 domain-containing protein n=1 Tax=Sphagnum troendelagicum TaxID=128251 RepID=A0ABP0TE23_9BRYO